MYILFSIIYLILIILDITQFSTPISTLYDPKALSIVIFSGILYIIGMRCYEEFQLGYRFFFNPALKIDDERKERVDKVFDGLFKFIILAGLILVVTRLIGNGGFMFSYTTLNPILYSLILVTLFVYPVKKRMQVGTIKPRFDEIKSSIRPKAKEAFVEAIEEHSQEREE